VPIWIKIVSAVALPEKASTVAVPATDPARRRTDARPSLVLACWLSSAPRVVEKVTSVPFWTGVPAPSATLAVIVVSPSRETTAWLATSITVDPVGASSGTLSHAESVGRARSIRSACWLRIGHFTGMLST
jgi:hypothetical protein